MKQRGWFVFDVESVGLHGEGFAVGYVVLDAEFQVVESGMFACDRTHARGSQSGHEWCAKNIPPLTITHTSARAVRTAFFERWLAWKETSTLVAECGWPVEARFLAQCIDDHPGAREWSGPYPMHELATLMFVAGMDPMATWARNDDEKPPHDPLADTRLSVRILKTVLEKLAATRSASGSAERKESERAG